MSEKTGTDKQVRTHKRRHYYFTDYVNHAVRFFMTTPNTLDMKQKRKSGKSMTKVDVDNWVAVQSVYHFLKPEEKQVLTSVVSTDFTLSEGVRKYCQETGTDEQNVWDLITRVYYAIARQRGLI